MNVAVSGNHVYAATRGEIYCLDAQSGTIRWHNPLKGYGWGLITMAGEGLTTDSSTLSAEKRRRDEQQAAASNSSVAST